MLECVPNVSEGRDGDTVESFARACGPALLDVHVDPDHHRSVLTLAAPSPAPVEEAVRALARAVADHLDLRGHDGVHPRLGALDVVPFVALDDTPTAMAVTAAREFAAWVGTTLDLPAFVYGDADPDRRTLPQVRADAFTRRAPDFGPSEPHPRLGAVAIGARPPLVAVNVELASSELELAKTIARELRERDGGLPGVRALGFPVGSRGRVQVSMNLVDLDATGIEAACAEVRSRARAAGTSVARIELVGLVPEGEYERTSAAFRQWSGIGRDQTIEARLAARP